MTELADELKEDVDVITDDEPDVTLEDDVETEAEAEDEAETAEGDDTEAEAEESESIVVSIGDTPAPEDEAERAPDWVRDLRKQHREEKRRNRELQEQLDALSGAAKPAELGEKPTLKSSQFDEAKFEADLAEWYERKREHDEAQRAMQAEQEAAEKEWNGRLESYQTAKSGLRVSDYDDAEEVVQDTLSVTQQGMILQGAENPALLVYALGKNQARAKELGNIKDPVKFAFAVAKLETQLKVSSKKAPSKPEKMISGTARKSGTVDNTLERLREEANKSGDYSKVTAYKRSQRAT